MAVAGFPDEFKCWVDLYAGGETYPYACMVICYGDTNHS